MKKIFTLFIVLISFVVADSIPNVSATTITPVCNVFEDVLQTRNIGSEIKHKIGASATITKNRDLLLNTSNVDFGSWQALHCDGGDCSASGKYGKGLNINYSNIPLTATLSNAPSSTTSKTTIKTNPNNFTGKNYGEIETSWSGSYPYNLDFNINGFLNINSFDLKTNNTDIKFHSNSQYTLDIGTINNNSTGHKIYTDSNAKDIKIKKLALGAGVDINLMASKTIKFETLKFGRNNSNVVLKAPYVEINSLTASNSGSNKANITIYADVIDISNLDLQQNATLIIKPFTAGKKVVFRTNSIKESSSSTILMSSGSYYTKTLSLPGTSSVCSMKAIDNNQIINLFIDGSLNPGNNPGLNSNGNNGNYGSLNPANFMVFINGDLTTGGGGTTFNATIYVEGSASLGSPTYLKGAISAGGDITIGNGSKFVFDQNNIDSLGFGLCNNIDDNFVYQCGIFQSALNTYNTLNINNNNLVINSESVVAKNINGNIDCKMGSVTSKCEQKEPPVNKLPLPTFSNTTISSIMNIDSSSTILGGDTGSFDIKSNGVTLNFKANEKYNNNPNIKVMRIADINTSKNNITLKFSEGDYWINSLNLNGNNINIEVTGSVRLFIKNDFYVDSNNFNVNRAGEAKNLQIYDYSNIDLANNGSANYNIVAYVYAKGNIDIKSHSNLGSGFKGALTSEGDISINNNQNFIYDGVGLDDIGAMKCYVCYSTDSSHGFVYRTGFMFGKINVPIINNSDSKISNVEVTKTHKSNFSLTFLGHYEVRDQDGNKIGNATKNSNTDYSPFPEAMSMSLDSDSILYNLGTESSYDNIHYKSAYESYLFHFSFNFRDWVNNAVYLVQYNDSKNRHYKTILEPCNFTDDSFSHGQFDAWDKDKNINDRDITTKIVNKSFILTLASLNNDNNGFLNRNEKVKYYLINNENNSSITAKNFINFHVYAKQNISFLVKSAYKNVSVAYDVCHLASDGDSNWTIHNYSDCTNSDKSLKIGTIISSDNFAIRPDKFKILYSGNKAYSGEDFNLTLNAVDATNKNTNLYNEKKDTSFKVEMKDLNSSCDYGSFVGNDFQFKNGESNITGYYTGMGDINISLHEIAGSEFAKVDEDDTPDSQRFISPSESDIEIYPYQIKINNVSLSSKNGKYVYSISDGNLSEMNISVDVNMSVLDKFGNELKDFNSTCGFDFNSSFYYVLENINNLETATYKGTIDDSNKSISDINKTIIFPKSIFVAGNGIGGYYFNIDKNISVPHKPININLLKVMLDSKAKINDDASVNQNLSVYYGRIKISDVRTKNNDVNVTAYYEVYDPDNKLTSYKADDENRYWKILSIHTNLDGKITKAYVNSDIILANIYNVHNGEQNLSVKYNGNSKPYRVKVHLNSKSWLWTSLFGEKYKAPSSTNKDCLTHYCVSVTFVGKSAGWVGVSANTNIKEETNASKRAVDINTSNVTHDHNKVFIKIIW